MFQLLVALFEEAPQVSGQKCFLCKCTNWPPRGFKDELVGHLRSIRPDRFEPVHMPERAESTFDHLIDKLVRTIKLRDLNLKSLRSSQMLSFPGYRFTELDTSRFSPRNHGF